MPQAKRLVTAAEYLARERAAPTRSEFLGGEVFTMAGASRRHNLISLNVAAELRAQLRRRPCEVYSHDMRGKIESSGLYTYPDVVAVCGEPTFEDAELDTLLDPTLIAEVLSESTADYDRGAKFEHYRSLASLAEYLLVAQDKVHLVRYARRVDGTWVLSESSDPQGRVELPSIGAELALAEVYAKVRFEEGGQGSREHGPRGI